MKSIILLVFVICFFLNCENNHISKDITLKSDSSTPVYRPKILYVYPHDQDAFTQGMLFYNGFMYESTGLYGHSSLRKVELESGSIIKKIDLSPDYFGEGITLFNNQVIQLTWHAKKGFIYDLDHFNLIKEFRYPMEGWGITFDGQYLVISDGTAILYYLDPESFQIIKQVNVQENGKSINRLNELEYIKGNIYANIWETDQIAIISPDGKVIGWIDLQGILLVDDCSQTTGVLNGIAFNTQNQRIYVTGKNWCKLFEIELVP
jgi:glutamine cyclotransferase